MLILEFSINYLILNIVTSHNWYFHVTQDFILFYPNYVYICVRETIHLNSIIRSFIVRMGQLHWTQHNLFKHSTLIYNYYFFFSSYALLTCIFFSSKISFVIFGFFLYFLGERLHFSPIQIVKSKNISSSDFIIQTLHIHHTSKHV